MAKNQSGRTGIETNVSFKFGLQINSVVDPVPH